MHAPRKIVVLAGSALAALALAGGDLAYAASASTPAPVTSSARTPAPAAGAPARSASGTAPARSASGTDTSVATVRREAPERTHEADGPGGHADPNGANVNHQFDGNE